MHARSVANVIIQGIYPFSFRERVKTRLKWSERDDTNPEQVRKTVLEIAAVIEEKEGNRAMDKEMEQQRRKSGS